MSKDRRLRISWKFSPVRLHRYEQEGLGSFLEARNGPSDHLRSINWIKFVVVLRMFWRTDYNHFQAVNVQSVPQLVLYLHLCFGSASTTCMDHGWSFSMSFPQSWQLVAQAEARWKAEVSESLFFFLQDDVVHLVVCCDLGWANIKYLHHSTSIISINI